MVESTLLPVVPAPVPPDDSVCVRFGFARCALGLVEALKAGVLVVNADGRVAYLNEAGASILGVEVDDTIDRDVAEIVAPLERLRITGESRGRWGDRSEVDVVRKDGTHTWIGFKMTEVSDMVTILEKPLSVTDLRELIRQKLERSETGGSPLEITDYLQLAAMGRSSARLEANLQDGRTAVLFIVDGDIWSAFLGEIQGEDVVRELLAATTVSIVMRALDGPRPERQIDVSCERLLLNLATAEDERDREPVEDDDTGEAESDIDPLFAEAFAEGIEASMEKDFQVAAEAFQRALTHKPDDPQALYNLERVQSILESE